MSVGYVDEFKELIATFNETPLISVRKENCFVGISLWKLFLENI